MPAQQTDFFGLPPYENTFAAAAPQLLSEGPIIIPSSCAAYSRRSTSTPSETWRAKCQQASCPTVSKNVSTPAQAYLEKLKVTSEYHSRPCVAACIRRHCKICKGSDLTTELPTSEIFCDPQSTEFRLTCTSNQASSHVPPPPPPALLHGALLPEAV